MSTSLEEAQDYWAEGVTSVMPDHAERCLQMLRRTMTRAAAIAEFRHEHPSGAVTVYDEPRPRDGASWDNCFAHAEVDEGGGSKLLVSGALATPFEHTYTWE